MRKASLNRKTKETDIKLEITIDGRGTSEIRTGLCFFDHMLELFCKHGLFDLKLDCKGDLQVDGHHTVEDIGILLGKAFNEALEDKSGIKRYANVFSPMDESLSLIVVDISGRPYISYEVEFTRERIGDFDTELVEEFLRALANNCGLTLHIKMLKGDNTHHMIESLFKGLGRALDIASTKDERIDGVMSTKGVI